MAGTIMRVSSCARDPVRTGLKTASTTLSWSTCLAPIAQGLECTNSHGRTVSLCGGAGAVAGVVTAGIEADRPLRGRTGSFLRVGLTATIAAGAEGRAGVVGDLDARAHDGDTPVEGLKGYLITPAHGRVTTGTLKITIIDLGAFVGGALLAHHRSAGASARPLASSTVNAASGVAVIAAWANLLDPLDLRFGRALKAACIVSTPLLTTPGRDGEPIRMLAVGTLGVSLAALPEDLLESTMLEGTGANAVDTLLGTALACCPYVAVRAGTVLNGVSLILASEKVFPSCVISEIPVLVALDGLGRRR